MDETPWKPTPVQVAAARGKTIRDVLAEDLDVLFCGINPSLYSAAVGHHFARPGNRFWPTLHAAGFTEELLSPFADRRLLERRCGLTNLVARATAAASEVTTSEFVVGGQRLRRVLQRYRPRVIAVLGITAFRAAFDLRDASLGRQPELLAESIVWVLPSPSGLNAHYQLAGLARLFAEMRTALQPTGRT